MAGIVRGKEAFLKNSGGGSGEGVDFLRIEPDTTLEVVPLAGLEDVDNALKVYQHEDWAHDPTVIHVCIGESNGCPGCQRGMGGRTRYFLPAVEKPGTDANLVIWAFGPQIKEQIQTYYEDDPDAFAGRVFKLRRNGSGKGTSYQVWPEAKNLETYGMEVSDFDLPVIDERLGPLDKQGIQELYARKEYGVSADSEADGEGWVDMD